MKLSRICVCVAFCLISVWVTSLNDCKMMMMTRVIIIDIYERALSMTITYNKM